MTLAETAQTVDELAASGAVPPSDFSDCPERVSEVAATDLELPGSMDATVDQVLAAGLFDRTIVEEAVAGLVTGHLLLTGPPGTGKTLLAQLLARVFNAGLITETANPEWSVYDVIGSQTIAPGGHVAPRHGVVTRAIMECAARMVARMDTGEGEQAVWLFIDEINRAEIDRAFGPLFTALSNAEGGSFNLDYMDHRPPLAIPRTFRIVAAMNDYDTRFVSGMSAALRRRFARVMVLPPASEEDPESGLPLSSDEELTLALYQARGRLAEKFGADEVAAGAEAIEASREEWRRVFGAIRSLGDKGGIPIGTAQVVDCLSYALVLVLLYGAPASGPGVWELIDRTLVTRLVSGLESDATRLRIGDEYVERLRGAFPQLTRTTDRLSRFLGGTH